MFFVICCFFFKINFQARTIRPGKPPECKTDWIQIRPDVLSGLIRLQSVCKGYDHTKLVVNELRVFLLSFICVILFQGGGGVWVFSHTRSEFLLFLPM